MLMPPLLRDADAAIFFIAADADDAIATLMPPLR